MTENVNSHQPTIHGYHAKDIKNWSPETDPHAKYLRSRVPLAKRITPFAATQANPGLSSKPQVMNLAPDYNNMKTGYKYNDTFCCNLLKFWQYTDFYGSWHGVPVTGSDIDSPDYGVINIPNPAYTDAAHRNGVLSLGCWFWPREVQFSDLLEQLADGSFPVADKMIEMAEYFGFDGYFFNQEAAVSPEDASKLLEMVKYLRKKAPAHFHIQWYDAMLPDGSLKYQNQFNAKNSPWMIDNGEPGIHSMFVNYAWNEKRINDSVEFAKSLGLDPYQVLFPGTENYKYAYNPPYDTRAIFPEGAEPRTSWALFGTDFTWDRYSNKFDPDDQEAVHKRERLYWSGPTEDPTDRIGRTLYEPYPDPFHEVDPWEYRKWDGVAHYIPERSVIGGYPFVTRFNTGHGRAFFVEGQVSSAKEWNNAGIQDILPSWQWWVRSGGSEAPLNVSYDYSVAYNGGSSLKVSGTLGPDNTTEVRLFKTKLSVSPEVGLSVTYRTAAAAATSKLKVGLLFEDDPSDFVWLEIGGGTNAAWSKRTVSLEAYSGRTIAAIGLGFESTAKSSEHAFYIGELALNDAPASRPAAPTGFRVDQAYFNDNKAELFLSWDFASSGVWYYEINRLKSDGGKEVIGRIYDEVYYVKGLEQVGGEPTAELELTAVGFDGTASDPAHAQINFC
ncbi:endo-beta-N-acetylglucosaminidase [Paenibacillus spongiae]|uniref:Mannosyl-glycoprotein endo-beta-N-acetylglucosaminidase n=1 Tax=Paenibacillus spongiae TaxID=2909671 RepID=A0ABY5S492_9BACL|nr:hypothetical protein [Paenibacillus spongiae]UVI28400.1 hypothetical protein L1F29_23505 [Paenibacillus spongiae]